MYVIDFSPREISFYLISTYNGSNEKCMYMQVVKKKTNICTCTLQIHVHVRVCMFISYQRLVFVINNCATKHDTTKLIASFRSESNTRSNDINISHYEKYPKIGEMSLLQTWCSSKFGHFCNVLKTLNKSYQQTHHLELNRMVQTILMQQVRLLRYFVRYMYQSIEGWSFVQ